MMARKITIEALQQRQRAARKHGIRAYQVRGDESLTPVQRSRLAELFDNTETREGVIQMVRERTTQALLICEMAESWMRSQAELGVAFDKQTLLRRISTYQETARRHLALLWVMLPASEGARDITELLEGKSDGD